MSAFVFLSFVGLFTFFTFRPPAVPTPIPLAPSAEHTVAPASEEQTPPTAQNSSAEVNAPQSSEAVPVVTPTVQPEQEIPPSAPVEPPPVEEGVTSSSAEAQTAPLEVIPPEAAIPTDAIPSASGNAAVVEAPPLPPETIPDPVLVLDEGETQGENEEHTEPQPDIVQLLQEQATP